jgi:hypothetical protein
MVYGLALGHAPDLGFSAHPLRTPTVFLSKNRCGKVLYACWTAVTDWGKSKMRALTSLLDTEPCLISILLYWQKRFSQLLICLPINL